MATHTSPSGASTRLSFEFIGSTADISTLTPVSLGGAPTPVEPVKPVEPTPVEPTPVEPTPVEPQPVPPTPVTPPTPVEEVPNTGFFTGDSSLDPAPLFVFGAVLAILTTIAVIIYRRRPRVHHDYSFYAADRLCIHDIRTSGRRLGISLAGLFSFFLCLGVFIPQLIAPASDTQSNAVENYLSLTVSSATASPSARLTSRLTLALTSQTVTSTTPAFDLYVNVAEDSQNGNYLFLDGDTTKGYIAPTSGTLTNKRPLSANEWGFTLSGLSAARNNSSIWAAVPLYGATTPANRIHSSTESSTSVSITFGAAGLASTTPDGSHQQTIIYTAISGI